MHAGAELRHHAVPPAILCAVVGDEIAQHEGTGEHVVLERGAVGGPGQDGFVADVLVDFRAAFPGGFCDVAEEVVQQLMETHRAQPLRDARRILHVDQQEGPELAARPDVAAGQQPADHAEAEQAAYGEDFVC